MHVCLSYAYLVSAEARRTVRVVVLGTRDYYLLLLRLSYCTAQGVRTFLNFPGCTIVNNILKEQSISLYF